MEMGLPLSEGTLSAQPVGLASLSKAPRLSTASMMTARRVALMMPMRMAPRTLRMCRMIVRKRPTRKTMTGHPLREPPRPSSRGVPPARTTLASTSPMRAMNRPMPTLIAVRRNGGTARKTASRKPVRTRTRMMTPSMTTMPMASAKVMP